MEYIEKIKKMMCKELEEYANQNNVSSADVEMIHKLTDTIKNLDKIEMLEGDDGYSGDYAMRYDDGVSYARGRGRYAKRDSMGRYSSDYSSNRDRNMEDYERRYSRAEAKDHIMERLGELMESADPNERETLKEAMRKIEKM